VSASEFNAEQVRERYAVDPVVVYNGVDLDRFTPDSAGDDAVLNRLGLTADPGRPALLYAGRLIKWKGVEYLLRALPRLTEPWSVLWVAGEGPYEDDLRDIARDTGVEDRVIFLGKVEQTDLAALYRNAGMLVATSFVNETFGMALCEAMACCAPVVASAFGGFREVVVDGETGLLVRPQDPIDLAAKIDTLLVDPNLRRTMGTAGRQRVLAMFSWEAVASRLEEVYRCLRRSST
jgi:glycosyltransferase involved in cell wall biosynthesis